MAAAQPERPEDFLIVQLDKMPKNVMRGTLLLAHDMTKRKENAIVIPPSALRTMGSRTYVQVVEQDGTKREVDVEVGQQTATETEIVKGLDTGAESCRAIADGDSVISLFVPQNVEHAMDDAQLAGRINYRGGIRHQYPDVFGRRVEAGRCPVA